MDLPFSKEKSIGHRLAALLISSLILLIYAVIFVMVYFTDVKSK